MATLATKLKKLTKQIDQKPFMVLEKLIEFIRNEKHLEVNGIRQIFDQVEITIIKCIAEGGGSKVIDNVFDRNLQYNDKECVASIFLRILFVNRKAFNSDKEIKFKSFGLFDEVFKGIYSKHGIQAKDQNYIKEDMLLAFVNNLEIEIRDCVKTISDFNSMLSFEKEYKRILFNKLNYNYIKHFLPPNYTRSKIDEIFNLLKTNINIGIKDRSQYKILHSSIKEIIRFSEDYNTYYSRALMYDPFKLILRIINNEIANGSSMKPALLKIKLADKKYPLHNVNKSFKIGLILENREKSEAFNVVTQISNPDDAVEINQIRIEYREIRNASTMFDIECKLKQVSESITLVGFLEWENFDGQKTKEHFSLKVDGQENNISWEELKFEDPYSIEPVETEEELIGRNEILDRMFAKMKGSSIGSFFIHGQKRVGKTSIAKTLRSKILKNLGNDFLVLYIAYS